MFDSTSASMFDSRFDSTVNFHRLINRHHTTAGHTVMSTRASIVYFPDKHLHLYHELFAENSIYLQGDFGQIRMETSANEWKTDVILRFSQADFDMLVDAYVAERERRKAVVAERLERQANCPKHEAAEQTPEIARWFEPWCRHCRAQMPSESE